MKMSMISFCSPVFLFFCSCGSIPFVLVDRSVLPVGTGRTDRSTRTDLKHTDYYLCSKNNATTPFLILLGDSKFLEITFRCIKIEAKKDF